MRCKRKGNWRLSLSQASIALSLATHIKLCHYYNVAGRLRVVCTPSGSYPFKITHRDGWNGYRKILGLSGKLDLLKWKVCKCNLQRKQQLLDFYRTLAVMSTLSWKHLHLIVPSSKLRRRYLLLKASSILHSLTPRSSPALKNDNAASEQPNKVRKWSCCRHALLLKRYPVQTYGS